MSAVETEHRMSASEALEVRPASDGAEQAAPPPPAEVDAAGGEAGGGEAAGGEAVRKRRGVLWMIGSFAICPCHLPVTLAVASTVLGGTALGATLHRHIILAGVIISVVWGLGMWRGLKLLRSGGACAVPQAGARRTWATLWLRKTAPRQGR